MGGRQAQRGRKEEECGVSMYATHVCRLSARVRLRSLIVSPPGICYSVQRVLYSLQPSSIFFRHSSLASLAL